MGCIYDLGLQGRNWLSFMVTAFVKFVLPVEKSKTFSIILVSIPTNDVEVVVLDIRFLPQHLSLTGTYVCCTTAKFL